MVCLLGRLEYGKPTMFITFYFHVQVYPNHLKIELVKKRPGPNREYWFELERKGTTNIQEEPAVQLECKSEAERDGWVKLVRDIQEPFIWPQWK